jgi:hypothetical protein
MPRKKKTAPVYRLEVVAPVNGRVHKADIRAIDAEGKVAYTDRAKLAEASERHKATQRITKTLKLKNTVTVEADLEQAWAAAVEEQRRKQEEQQAPKEESPASEHRPGAPYFVDKGRIYRRRYDREGNEVSPEALCNFAAAIEAETIYDDGSGEIQHCFRLVGRLWSGEPLAAVDVPAGDFATMNWPIKHWGVRAIVSPGQGAKDHLRAAIQELSGNAQRRIVYRQTGWRQIGGEWLFLHSAGAVGTVGTVTAHHIDLPGNLTLIALPDPPEGDNLAAAVRASLRVLDLSRERITAPLLGAVYRAPLGSIDFAEHLVGPSGCFTDSSISKATITPPQVRQPRPGMHSTSLAGTSNR